MIGPSDALAALLVGFGLLGLVWLAFLTRLVVRAARGGDRRGE